MPDEKKEHPVHEERPGRGRGQPDHPDKPGQNKPDQPVDPNAPRPDNTLPGDLPEDEEPPKPTQLPA